MQPLAGDAYGILLSKRDNSRIQPPLNSVEFLAKKPEEVSVDEVFFHKYFSQVGTHKKSDSKPKKTKPEAAEDSFEDDEDDDEIWKALVGSRPEIEGSEDEDDDLDMVELESDDEEEGQEDEELHPSGTDLEDEGAEEDDMDASKGANLESLFLDEEDDEVPSSIPEPADGKSADGHPESKSQSRRQKRRKLKHLPTFASADDYADMLVDEEDDLK